MEVPEDEVLRRVAHLARVQAVAALLLVVDHDETLLRHYAPDDLLRDAHGVLALAEHRPDEPVAPRCAEAVEDFPDALAERPVLVVRRHARELVVEAAPRKPEALEQQQDGGRPLQRVDDGGLFPVGEGPMVDVRVLFWALRIF